MALTKYKLGDLIEPCEAKNRDLKYGIDDVRGISTGKEFIDTKANLDGVGLNSYKIVFPNEFAYVSDTSRRGDKMALALNKSNQGILISSIYTVFRVKDKEVLDSNYLFMYFNRPEFDRYSRFNSWGSAREVFSWEDMCDIDIDLPDIEIQRKYVAIYNALLANQQSYERGLDDLKLVCESLIEECKHKAKRKTVGSILSEVDIRNSNGLTDVRGINIDKQFMPTVADTNGVNLLKYKVVQKGQFAFSGMQTGRDECIRISLFNEEKPIIISPAYSVLENLNKSVISEYVMMWFSRKECDRLGWFMSDASIRTNLEMDRFYEIEIPTPSLEIQKSIVNIYNCYIERKRINEQLKAQIKDICPILIKGSIEEGRKEE